MMTLLAQKSNLPIGFQAMFYSFCLLLKYCFFEKPSMTVEISYAHV